MNSKQKRAERQAAGICTFCPTPVTTRTKAGKLHRSCDFCRARDRKRKRIEQKSKPQLLRHRDSGGSHPGVAELFWESDLEIAGEEVMMALGENPEDQ